MVGSIVRLDSYFLYLLFSWPKQIYQLCLKLGKTCMGRLEKSIYGVCIETSVITLTTLSVLAITGELLIGLKILQEPPSLSGRNKNVTTEQTAVTSQTDSTYDEGGDNLTYKLFIANSVFHYVSLTIAALFLFEITLKILSRGRSFFVFPWQIFDCLVILVTFGIEVTFIVVSLPKPYWEAMTYIVVLRYWRIPSVCNIKANARQAELNQELASWREAKQKSDEKCRNLQYKLDQLKLDTMVNSIGNGHIPGKGSNAENGTKDRSYSAPVPHILENSPNKTLNGIIKTSKQNGYRVGNQLGTDETDSVVITKHNSIEQIEKVETVQRVKSVNFDVGSDTDTLKSQSPSPSRLRQVSKPNGYSRTDSESSISYQATEEEVVVQIENAIQSELNSPDDVTCLIPEGTPDTEDFSYDNATFDDMDDLVLRKDLQVMADIDGTKTYRSADGIPMTSL